VFVFVSIAIFLEAWLITGGLNVGIVRVVGQAIKKAKLINRNNKSIAIAVCKWGSVQNVETIISSKAGGYLVRDLRFNEKALSRIIDESFRQTKIGRCREEQASLR
jgi:hypothetical protein